MASNLEVQLAPVVIFVYNRPQHTQRTISALLNNTLARETDVIIYSDAAKVDAQSDNVNAVREYINKVSGFRSIRIVERTRNFGLARSIIEGVTEACEQYGNVIVLEDDLETSPYFLEFMNQALGKYAKTEEVMHISGCSYPIRQIEEQGTYFLNVPLCWGWATWQRAWKKFSNDVAVMDRFDATMIRSFNFDNSYPYWAQLELNRAGKIRTWFVFWYATVFLQSGLCLFPSRSLVKNVGFDRSGVNCDQTDVYDVPVSDAPVNVATIPLTVSELAVSRHIEYFKSIKPGLLRKFVGKMRRLMAMIRYQFTSA